jgi:hypothetical protein
MALRFRKFPKPGTEFPRIEFAGNRVSEKRCIGRSLAYTPIEVRSAEAVVQRAVEYYQWWNGLTVEEPVREKVGAE